MWYAYYNYLDIQNLKKLTKMYININLSILPSVDIYKLYSIINIKVKPYRRYITLER